MKKFIVCSLAILGLVSCAKDKDSDDKDSFKRPAITVEEYEDLISLTGEALWRKAMVGDLGACSVRTVEMLHTYGDRECPAKQVYLKDKEVFYPGMEENPPLRRDCGRRYENYAQGRLSDALHEGFCFDVQ